MAENIVTNDRLVLERGEVLSTVEQVRVGGRTRHLLVSKFPIVQDDDSVFLAGLAVDITDQKKAEEDRIRLAAQLQQAKKMEAIGSLAGGVAHDLNNILSGIVSYPELMLMNLPADDPLRSPLELIKASGERAAGIVQDLLMLSSGGIPEPRPAQINRIIADYMDSERHAALLQQYPDIHFDTELASDTLDILGSDLMLKKSIEHLVSNAAASIKKGKGQVRITTKNRFVDKPLDVHQEAIAGDCVIVQVLDDGPPLTTEQQERVFEPFYTKKIMGREGSGLGMTIVWGTVKDHHGYIDIETPDGGGNRLTLYFPARRMESGKPADDQSLSSIMGGGETILVVDDMAEQRDIATRMLDELGYQVAAVPSGEEALQYLRSYPADLVILDMIMEPGMNGVETYRKILEFRPLQKAIIASGTSENQEIHDALKTGAGSFLKKPYLIDKLAHAVREQLDR